MQGRRLGEAEQDVVARIRPLALLAKARGIVADVARTAGRLRPGGRPNAASLDNRTSTGVLGTMPERSRSRVAASNPGGLGSTPGVRYPGSGHGREAEDGEGSQNRLLRLMLRQVDAVAALAHRVSHDGTADAPAHEPKNIVSNMEYTSDLPL